MLIPVRLLFSISCYDQNMRTPSRLLSVLRSSKAQSTPQCSIPCLLRFIQSLSVKSYAFTLNFFRSTSKQFLKLKCVFFGAVTLIVHRRFGCFLAVTLVVEFTAFRLNL